MKREGERLINGLFKENPTFVLMLGMCPTLAVTTSAINGLGMGLTTMVVLALSNAIISLLRNIIPDRVRIPAFIVIIASFVTIMQFLLEGFIPSLYSSLGLYIPLIVVNCIILGRAESYASKNPVLPSLFDGIGMGLGFTMALTIIGAVRELIGSGDLFGVRVMPANYVPVAIFVMAPGAFFVLAFLTAIQNKIRIVGAKKGKDVSKIGSGCSEDCMNCGDTSCTRRLIDTDSKPGETVAQGAERRENEAKAAGTKEEAAEAQSEQETGAKKEVAESQPEPAEESKETAESQSEQVEEPSKEAAESQIEPTEESKEETDESQPEPVEEPSKEAAESQPEPTGESNNATAESQEQVTESNEEEVKADD